MHAMNQDTGPITLWTSMWNKKSKEFWKVLEKLQILVDGERFVCCNHRFKKKNKKKQVVI